MEMIVGSIAGAMGTTAPAWLAPALSVGGTLLQLGGAAKTASAYKASAAAEKQQLDYAAGQSEAAGQHAAELQRRKAELMISRAMAVGAASGSGTAGMEGVLQGIAKEGEMNAGAELYTGNEKAAGYRYKGDVGVAAAKQKSNATLLGAFGSAGLSLADRFKPRDIPGEIDFGTPQEDFNYVWGQ